MPDEKVSTLDWATLTMLFRGCAGPNCVINDFAAPLNVNTGFTADDPVRYAKFVVRPEVAVASKVAVGVMSSGGGAAGGGGVLFGGGIRAAAATATSE